MVRLRILSGKEVCAILRKSGFEEVRRRGSHVVMQKKITPERAGDYRDPEKLFSRTCFTRVLKDHAGMVLQRLSGKTEGAAPGPEFIHMKPGIDRS